MAQKAFIYIDQNILRYDYENQIKLISLQDFDWVYSEEHFNEIYRKDSSQVFDVIERIKARKIKIKLNEKFQITDEAVIYPFDDPKKMYADYLSTIEKYKLSTSLFTRLLPFFFGNVESIDPDQYAEDFKKSILTVTQDFPTEITQSEIWKENIKKISTIADDLKNTLIKAKESIKPLDKSRRYLSKNQFSNIDETKGPVIDQIWQEIADKFAPITKDQFFGKELLPFYNQNQTNRNQIIFLGIAQCHMVLNYLGYWPDEGLSKPSKIFGINSDASHIAHSYFCSGFMSADDRLCKKARAIYQYFGKPISILQVKFD